MTDPTNTHADHPSLVTVVALSAAPDPTETESHHPSTVTQPGR